MRATSSRVALILAVLFLGVATYQPLTRGYVYANIGSLFAWSGSAQSWSGSSVVLSCSDWNSFIKNDGTACPTSKTVLDSFAIAHAVVTVTHSPLVANNTFAGGNFASWTSTNSGSCNGYVFTGQNAPDEDTPNDNGFAYASSASCGATAAVVNLSQTFSTGGAPTSQTYSFWYNAPVTIAGNTNCTQGTGSVGLVASINGTSLPAISVTVDGAWHHVSGTTTLMVNGSNTFKVAATLNGAVGNLGYYKNGVFTCSPNSFSKAQTVSIDNVVLTGAW